MKALFREIGLRYDAWVNRPGTKKALSREIGELRKGYTELEANARLVLQRAKNAERDLGREKARADGLQAIIDATPKIHRDAFGLVKRVLSNVGLIRRDKAVFYLSSIGQIMECRGPALERLGYDTKLLSGSGSLRHDYFGLLHPDDVAGVREALSHVGSHNEVLGFRYVVGMRHKEGEVYAPYELRVRIRRRGKDPDKSVSIVMKRQPVGVGVSNTPEIETINITDEIDRNERLHKKAIDYLDGLRRKVRDGYALTLNVESLYLGDDEVKGLVKDIFSGGRVHVLQVSSDLIYTALREVGVSNEAFGVAEGVRYDCLDDKTPRVKKSRERIEPA